MKLENKVAVVAGGSRGIGRAICLRLASEGAKVIVNYSDKADQEEYAGSAEKVVDKIKAVGGEAIKYEADVADKIKVNEMMDFIIKQYGQLDILVANAGICPFEEFLKIEEELLDRVIGVNLKGAFFCSQSAMDKMVELGIKGRIIFTSSVSAVFGGELQTHYCATKGAINQLMKSIAIAGGKYGITSNAVLPGTVVTDINRKQLLEGNTGLYEYFIKRTPLGRLATPEDIAGAVLFFASGDADCISGTALTVDGGMSVNLQ
ncbi:MAG: SDR family NAD(P)-dependent oxidoreductase [Candidatus Omnitrophota bacterium]